MTSENELCLRALLPSAGGKTPPVEQVIAAYHLVTAVAKEAIPLHQPLPKSTPISPDQK